MDQVHLSARDNGRRRQNPSVLYTMVLGQKDLVRGTSAMATGQASPAFKSTTTRGDPDPLFQNCPQRCQHMRACAHSSSPCFPPTALASIQPMRRVTRRIRTPIPLRARPAAPPTLAFACLLLRRPSYRSASHEPHAEFCLAHCAFSPHAHHFLVLYCSHLPLST